MKNNLVLSVFCGLDLLGLGFEKQGFCVVQSKDILFGGDIRRFQPVPNRFDGLNQKDYEIKTDSYARSKCYRFSFRNSASWKPTNLKNQSFSKYFSISSLVQKKPFSYFSA